MASPTQDGYPAFVVTPNVTSFHGYGMASYIVFIQTTATLYEAEAIEAPTTRRCNSRTRSPCGSAAPGANSRSSMAPVVHAPPPIQERSVKRWT